MLIYMERTQLSSFKQERLINNWCLKKRSDFISKTVYYLVWSSSQTFLQKFHLTRFFLLKLTFFPSLLVFFMNTKPQTGKKCWDRGLICESKVNFFPVSYPGLFYAVSCLPYITQFLLLVWSSWMLESYFRRSRVCKIQTKWISRYQTL